MTIDQDRAQQENAFIAEVVSRLEQAARRTPMFDPFLNEETHIIEQRRTLILDFKFNGKVIFAWITQQIVPDGAGFKSTMACNGSAFHAFLEGNYQFTVRRNAPTKEDAIQFFLDLPTDKLFSYDYMSVLFATTMFPALGLTGPGPKAPKGP